MALSNGHEAISASRFNAVRQGSGFKPALSCRLRFNLFCPLTPHRITERCVVKMCSGAPVTTSNIHVSRS